MNKEDTKLYNKFDDLIVVGGGSAGWMTATNLIRKFPNKKITLVESPNIATVGVGESTIGGISNWLSSLSLNTEENIKEFMKETDGTIKLSIRFEDFYEKGDGGFHYPFGTPNVFDTLDGVNDWYFKKLSLPQTPITDFARSFYSQTHMVEQNTMTDTFPNFNWKKDKAFHFDATKFGLWLKNKICLPAGLIHIKSDIKEVLKDEENQVTGLVLDNGETLSGNLYFDCTGFKALLTSKAQETPFIDFSWMLPNDSAWATRLPYKDKRKELNAYTNCTAIENGWVWQIPLWSRWGTGYVYSSKYVSDEDALEEFKNYIRKKGYGDMSEDLQYKNIKMRVGRHDTMWNKNVVAVGLAAGFVEPLESNGLYSVHEFLNVFNIVMQRKDKFNQTDIDYYNDTCAGVFDNFARFVAMHYALSHRDDTKYWRDIQKRDYSADGHPCFKQMFARRRDNRFELHEGMQCIGVGLNFWPIDKCEVMLQTCSDDLDTFKIRWQPAITKLDARALNWELEAKKAPSIYDFLNDRYFKDYDENNRNTQFDPFKGTSIEGRD